MTNAPSISFYNGTEEDFIKSLKSHLSSHIQIPYYRQNDTHFDTHVFLRDNSSLIVYNYSGRSSDKPEQSVIARPLGPLNESLVIDALNSGVICNQVRLAGIDIQPGYESSRNPFGLMLYLLEQDLSRYLVRHKGDILYATSFEQTHLSINPQSKSTGQLLQEQRRLRNAVKVAHKNNISVKKLSTNNLEDMIGVFEKWVDEKLDNGEINNSTISLLRDRLEFSCEMERKGILRIHGAYQGDNLLAVNAHLEFGQQAAQYFRFQSPNKASAQTYLDLRVQESLRLSEPRITKLYIGIREVLANKSKINDNIVRDEEQDAKNKDGEEIKVTRSSQEAYKSQFGIITETPLINTDISFASTKLALEHRI